MDRNSTSTDRNSTSTAAEIAAAELPRGMTTGCQHNDGLKLAVRLIVIGLAAGVSSAFGADELTAQGPATPSKTAPQDTAKREPSASRFVVEIASFDQIQKEIAKYRGKVVVVDYWSSWCAPCVKELPELVELQQQLGDKIVCLTVDVDFAGTDGEKPEQHRDNVRGILLKNKATMRAFLSMDADLTVFNKLQVASVPVLHVFDRDGKLHKSFNNENGAFGDQGFSILKHVKPVITPLLR